MKLEKKIVIMAVKDKSQYNDEKKAAAEASHPGQTNCRLGKKIGKLGAKPMGWAWVDDEYAVLNEVIAEGEEVDEFYTESVLMQDSPDGEEYFADVARHSSERGTESRATRIANATAQRDLMLAQQAGA